MGLYFYANGKPNLKFLTSSSLVLGLLMINAHEYSLVRVTDNSMNPYFHQYMSDNKLLKVMLSDYVLYKHYAIRNLTKDMK